MNILSEVIGNIYKYYAKNVFSKYLEETGKTNQYINKITSKSLSNLLFSLCSLKDETYVLVVEDGLKAEELKRELKIYSLNVEVLNPKEYRNFDVESESKDIYIERMRVLRELKRNKTDVLIVPIKALFQRMLPLEYIFSKKLNIYTLKYIEEINEDKNKNTKELKKENISNNFKSLDELVNKLINLGYQRENRVEGLGTFSLKGGILDIGLNKEIGVRIEFWGDDIESIRKFDISTQRSTSEVDKIEIYPVNENIVISEDVERALSKLNEYILKEDNLDIISEVKKDIKKIEDNNYFHIVEKYLDMFFGENINTLYSSLKQLNVNFIFYEIQNSFMRISNIQKDKIFNEEYIVSRNKYIPYYYSDKINYERDFEDIYKTCSTYINLLNLKNKYLPETYKTYDINITEKDFGDNLNVFIQNIVKTYDEFKQIIVFSKRTDEIKKILLENNIESEVIEKDLKDEIKSITDKSKQYEYIKSEKKKLEKEIGTKHTLNISNNNKKVLIYPENFDGTIEVVDANLIFTGFEKTKVKTQKRVYNKMFRDSKEVFFGDLEPGDYIVHKKYGIGIFLKIDKVSVLGITKEYLKLEYADDNYLYVPISNADNIRKFIGAKTDNLKLNSLNSKAWENTKTKLKKNLREVAGELIKLYSEREKSKGYAFPKDTKWQKDFESDFEYDETEDQLRCIDEIKENMEKPQPMDRLLCGDVGFGKTEVAQRAAFKAVMSGKQVAYLAPTTILVKQQYDGFVKRFKKFPVEIDYVSRMKSVSENKKTLQRVKEGKVDILIGTHRLLSSDVNFKDLGLLIVDEEHRFGVKAKEKIKFFKKEIDVLSMSATPIPRTLSMSLSGIRDMSVIYEPPKNRKPVKTFLLEYDKNIIDEAIMNEIERDGQVFYIHNRVKSIDGVYEDLSKRLKNVKFSIAHGQMSPKDTEAIMEKFINKEIDVLISTSIIENGIDIENANTMIIEDADRLGLAQLYQIRGRVGRGEKKAYCYLTYKKNKSLSENAEKRLRAIKDFTELGSGYKVALRDLEIRGAGSVLGEMQHGHIEQVGYDMYVKILNEVIAEAKNIEIPKEEDDVLIDLNIEMYIPDEYIDDEEDKIDAYQKIADSKTNKDFEVLLEEFKDRFGEVPNEVLKLIEIAKIKEILKKKGFNQIKETDGLIRMYFTENFNPDNVLELANSLKYGNKFKINYAKLYIELKLQNEEDFAKLNEIREFLERI